MQSQAFETAQHKNSNTWRSWYENQCNFCCDFCIKETASGMVTKISFQTLRPVNVSSVVLGCSVWSVCSFWILVTRWRLVHVSKWLDIKCHLIKKRKNCTKKAKQKKCFRMARFLYNLLIWNFEPWWILSCRLAMWLNVRIKSTHLRWLML